MFNEKNSPKANSTAGKKFYAVVFVLVCFVTINSMAQNLSPMHSCCDDGDARGLGLNDSTSVMKVENNCTDLPVTCRECVDRTRDHYLCPNSKGLSIFCLEDSHNPNGPRYYALYHPIIVSPLSLSFTAPYGYGCSNPAPQTFSVSNGVWQGLGIDYTLNWSATKTQDWLSVSPSSGTISGTTPITITVSISTAGLPAGTYQDNITIGATQVSSLQWETIPITLTITSSMSVSISGSTQLLCQQMGTWTAAVCGGVQPYHYQWSYNIVCGGALRNNANVIRPLLPPCGYWIAVTADDSPTFHNSYCSDFEVACEVTDALNHTATSNIIYVLVDSFTKLALTSPGVDQSVVKNTNEKTMVMPEELFEQKFYSDELFTQSYPNPFNPTTKISFSLPQKSQIKLKVFDVLGREIQILADDIYEAGKYEVEFNATNLPSGVYFYNLTTGSNSITKKMLLMK